MPKAIQGITVEHFFKTYKTRLKLELATGADGLHRIIREGSINRPSLALTGFFKYFAQRRIQVLGAAEMTFLKTLSAERQHEIITGMADRQIPCLVLTRNFIPTPAMLAVAKERRLAIFRTPKITMHFINLATLCIDNEFAPSVSEHATTLDIRGIGVMLRGGSGVGKSECALALIERGHSLVADDLTVIKLLDERELVASSRALNRGYMECRGIGIINVTEMFGIRCIRVEKRIDMVISMHEWTPDVVEERTGLEENFYEILGIKVPHIILYVRPGRDMARLVEVAALTQALKKIGHDPAKEFNARLVAFMIEQPVEPGRASRLDSPPAPPPPATDPGLVTDDASPRAPSPAGEAPPASPALATDDENPRREPPPPTSQPMSRQEPANDDEAPKREPPLLGPPASPGLVNDDEEDFRGE